MTHAHPGKVSLIPSLLIPFALLALLFTPLPAQTLNSVLENTELVVTTGGDAPWFPTYEMDAVYGSAAQTGVIGDDQSSWLETTVQGPGLLKFKWKVSSDPQSDTLGFLIDGEVVVSIDGDKNWEQKVLEIPRGERTIRWEYTKDSSGSANADTGWLDEVGYFIGGEIGGQWVQREIFPQAREGYAIAYDAARGRTVLYGGRISDSTLLTDTWEWDGDRWLQVSISGPPGQYEHAMAYDSTRERVVLFGYDSGLWEWDGVEWTQVTSTGPARRNDHAMAYDSARRRIVLFGGDFERTDTWEWDGVEWTQVATTGPPASWNPAMAYDSGRGRVVLFGGSFEGNDTWEWDGATWRQVITEIGPPARHQHSMSYDSERGRVVLFGGGGSSGRINDTWEWDGVDWTLQTPMTSPSPRVTFGMVYDSARRETVLFGGWGDSGLLTDTWIWDGSDWRSTGPSPRYDHAMAYDPVRGKTVLFGGHDDFFYETPEGTLGDTWEWDGEDWTRTATTGPSPRYGHTMEYDSDRERTVLVGGRTIDHIPLEDTWEWDGNVWIQSAVDGTEIAASGDLTFDAERDGAIYYGASGENWELEGTSSSLLATKEQPRIDGAATAFVSSRGRLVLFEGQVTTYREERTWEFDGSNWNVVAIGGPPLRFKHDMVYDAARDRIVLFGGSRGQYWESPFGDIWEFIPAPLHDRDNDGRPDACESTEDAVLAAPGTQVTNADLADSDGDGLLDGQESMEACSFQTSSLAETNPRDRDSDDDGFSDGMEVLVLLTDPLDPNSPDRTDPGFADADGDGLPASFDVDDNNPDRDGDRYVDGYEMERGFDPGDPTSKPSLGDGNGNGTLTAADVTLLKQVIQGLLPATAHLGNMDTTQNGRLGATDVTRLKQYIGDPDRTIP